MKSLGEYLQSERLAREITLEQISVDTRISMNMLRAIEEGNIEKLPAAVFTKGFLRAYAKQIGLDPEAVILRYQDLIEEVDARRETMEKFHQRLRPKSSKRKLAALLFILPLLVGLTLFLWRPKDIRQDSRPAKEGERSGAVQGEEEVPKTDSVLVAEQVETATHAQQAPDSTQVEIGPRQAKPGLDTQTPSVSPTQEGMSNIAEGSVDSTAESRGHIGEPFPGSAPYVLRAKALETTWLRITIDEAEGREYLLQPGEQMSWSANSGYKLHIGNAAGIQLHLNDKPIKPLGDRGRVIRLELPDASLILTSDSNTPIQ